MKARDLLDSPARWTRGCLARDSDGFPVHPESSDAVCWDVVGALVRLYSGAALQDAIDAVARAIPVEGGYFPDGEIEEWNDAAGRTFDEVRALIEKAGV